MIRSGTFFSVISFASPSAIAVLPTPDSPTNKGLFLLLLARIWVNLSISSALPIKGSILPSKASLLRFKVNFSRAVLESGSLVSVWESSPSTFTFSELPWLK